jgi:hypothetical protein
MLLEEMMCLLQTLQIRRLQKPQGLLLLLYPLHMINRYFYRLKNVVN